MSNVSTETTPSKEENDYIKLINESNLSNCFFKFLFALEEDNDKGLKEEIQHNLLTPLENVFPQPAVQ